MTFGLLDNNRQLLKQLEYYWGNWIIKSSFIPITVTGLENLDINQQYIFSSNHASLLDVPVTLSILKRPVLFMAKKELFLIPFFGWMLYAAGMIRVNRQNVAVAKESVNSAVNILKSNNVSMLVYPEGSRSDTNELLPLKKGNFILAIQSKIPIVPIKLHGTHDILPKHSLLLKPGKISMHFHKPIQTKDMTLEDKENLLEKVRMKLE